jgi:hypothetical protein
VLALRFPKHIAILTLIAVTGIALYYTAAGVLFSFETHWQAGLFSVAYNAMLLGALIGSAFLIKQDRRFRAVLTATIIWVLSTTALAPLFSASKGTGWTGEWNCECKGLRVPSGGLLATPLGPWDLFLFKISDKPQRTETCVGLTPRCER